MNTTRTRDFMIKAFTAATTLLLTLTTAQSALFDISAVPAIMLADYCRAAHVNRRHGMRGLCDLMISKSLDLAPRCNTERGSYRFNNDAGDDKLTVSNKVREELLKASDTWLKELPAVLAVQIIASQLYPCPK